MSAFNKAALFALFNEADAAGASLSDRLFTLGVTSREVARPLLVEWASAKYKTPIIKGQRGLTVKKDSAAEQAIKRVLAQCFPSADGRIKAKAKRAQVDPVTKLLAAYEKLTAAQKRSFKAKL